MVTIIEFGSYLIKSLQIKRAVRVIIEAQINIGFRRMCPSCTRPAKDNCADATDLCQLTNRLVYESLNVHVMILRKSAGHSPAPLVCGITPRQTAGLGQKRLW